MTFSSGDEAVLYHREMRGDYIPEHLLLLDARNAVHSALVQRKFLHFLSFSFSLPSSLPVLVLCSLSASAHAHTAYAKQYLETLENCREPS